MLWHNQPRSRAEVMTFLPPVFVTHLNFFLQHCWGLSLSFVHSFFLSLSHRYMFLSQAPSSFIAAYRILMWVTTEESRTLNRGSVCVMLYPLSYRENKDPESCCSCCSTGQQVHLVQLLQLSSPVAQIGLLICS